MTSDADQGKSEFGLEIETDELKLRAAAGSAWCALLLAMEIRPTSLTDLIEMIGFQDVEQLDVNKGETKERIFNAASDAWAMYFDALAQGASA